MVPRSTRTATSAEIHEALSAWGLDGARVSQLPGGMANEHWRIDAVGRGPMVLRRYHPRQTEESVAYEHRLLQFLADGDWPVAPAIVVSGGTQLENEAGRWAVFPLAAGNPPEDSHRLLQRKGALLAVLHGDLQEWDETEQRPGFERITDLDTPLRLDGFADFHALTAWDMLRHPERARAFEELRERNLQALAALGYDELPEQVVYFQCLGDNVLFQDDQVSALLDFDLAHRDARVADIARSLVVDGWMDGWRLHSFIAGYQAHAAPQLTRAEVDLLPPMMLAVEIWTTAIGLAISDRHPDAGLDAAIDEALTDRLPKLEAAQDELREVLRGAAGYPTIREDD